MKRPLYVGVPAPGEDPNEYNKRALASIEQWSHETDEVTENFDLNGHYLIVDDGFGFIDENGNEQLIFQTTASAVNYWEMTNAAANGVLRLEAKGDDTHVAITLASKGTDPINLEVNGNTEATLDATNFKPGANDGNALGASGTAWADLFLASGGIINWNAGNATITHSAGLLTLNVDLAVADEAYDASAWNGSLEVPTKNAIRDKFESLPAAEMPRGHLWGLGMSNAADADHDITVAVGEARSEDDSVDLTLAGAITKQIDAAWAVGTNAGGINTGSVANDTWYEVHLIRRSDTGVVDVMFTTTANRATLPTNYDDQRRIGWVRSDGSANIRAFTQVDDYFTLTTQINDVSASATTTATAVTLTVPPSTIARFRAALQGDGSFTSDVIVFSEIAEGDVTPAAATGIASLGGIDDLNSISAGHFQLRVSATSQIEHDSEAAVSTFDISTYGWIDTRGRLSGT